MTTTVVNKRSNGFKRSHNRIYTGRDSPWGNPFAHLPLSRTKARFQVATACPQADHLDGPEHTVKDGIGPPTWKRPTQGTAHVSEDAIDPQF
jgi:hypothetical protein